MTILSSFGPAAHIGTFVVGPFVAGQGVAGDHWDGMQGRTGDRPADRALAVAGRTPTTTVGKER